jgi:hypothetical protein
MTRKAKPRAAKPRFRGMLVACAVALAILLLLVRLINFAHGRR